MKVIDLSGIIESGMWWFGPPVPRVEFEEISSLERDGCISQKITFSTITGTYLETAAHMIKGARTIDEVKPEELICQATVVTVPQKSNRERITKEELLPMEKTFKAGEALLIATGWDRNWNKSDFVKESPYFSKNAMDYLLSKRISILGSDIVSFDDPHASHMDFVEKFFRKDSLILSPLINLGQIKQKKIKLIAFPLKLKGLSASPCRAVGIEK
jgi:kynurenine formamidase